MREILFKAKRIDNGEWVEGYYVNTCYSGEKNKTGHFIAVYPNKFYEIYTSTICQSTGLTDKNGQKIWENDVVYIPYERLEDSYCKVVFRRGSFIGEMADGCEDCIVNRNAEVIGNIFDNPELLEGE